MSQIIAGRFTEQEQVDRAIDAMVAAGFPQDGISSFYLNPPGQHNLYSIGGDRDESPGAHETQAGVVTGAATGGAVGAGVGLLGAPVFGPVGPAVGALVGAHVGGLIGSLSQMKEKGQDEEVNDADTRTDVSDNTVSQRKSGLMLAVSADGDQAHRHAVSLLRQFGANDIERTEGTIINGDWHDFDPLKPPNFLPPGTPAAH